MPFRILPFGTISCVVDLGAKGDGNDDEALQSLTAQIDNTTVSQVAAGAGVAEFVLSKKGEPAAGASVTVNVTCAGVNLRGDAITPLVLDFELQGPPLPPPATHLIVVGASLSSEPAPTDPGTDTVTLRVS